MDFFSRECLCKKRPGRGSITKHDRGQTWRKQRKTCCRSVAQLYPTVCNPMDCRLPCPSPSPRACSDWCPSSWWCHPTISSSVVPFSSCLQSFPASGSFQMSQFFTSGGQSIGASASASVLPMTIQGWYLLGLTVLIFFDRQESSPAPQFKSINFSTLSLLYGPTLTSIHDYWKNHSFD